MRCFVVERADARLPLHQMDLQLQPTQDWCVFFTFRVFWVYGIVRTSSGEFVKSKGTGQVDPELTGMHDHA